MESEVVSQFTSAAVIVYFLQMIKRSKFVPWLTMDTAKMNHLVAVALAFGTAIGIRVLFDQESGTLTVSGLTVTNVVSTGWHALQQYALQRVTYDAVAKPTPVPVVNVLSAAEVLARIPKVQP